MSVIGGVSMVLKAAREAFRDEPDTTTECAHDLYRFLVTEYQDYTRTEPYYQDIVRFVREWQPEMARQGSAYL